MVSILKIGLLSVKANAPTPTHETNILGHILMPFVQNKTRNKREKYSFLGRLGWGPYINHEEYE